MFFFKKYSFIHLKKESVLLIKRYFHVSVITTTLVQFKYSKFLKFYKS